MILRSGIAVVAALVLAGCSDSSSNRATPALSVDFTTFVKNEINNTRDDRNAVSINNTEFSFNDQDNEQAFDDLL
ncbi:MULTISPECIES: hypothetical protein [Marinobacter]|uniref:hypothetical protein n=1 Tax=Marinobacter TaxID=2742 RepID=UPI001C95B63F|nr:hypothetical protein [Marinobacter nauticus]MBY5937193.1 hypothetical protein [Marinobacter nauticus]MBY5954564.1 hypothetical protein [Marinobacter nauticus]MBY5962672.1 hypothetical protein [Marinobacter nauticus]MBY6008214.1 hypothetical protein [Marinobacter nauticus]MBY6101887.1 hypothetical protein [Marinobacter nauticus]